MDANEHKTRQLFVFTNTKGNGRTGWEDCLAMADDGTVLGGHMCSSVCFMMYDLVLREDRKREIEKYFGCKLEEIDIQGLAPGELPPPHVLKANEEQGRKAAAKKSKEEQANDH